MIEVDDRDPVRDYTEEELHRLTEQLRKVTWAIAAGDYRASHFDLALILRFHAALFDGVRGHAGRHRRPGFGSEYLTFGPQRSVHRDKVDAELAVVVQGVQRGLRQLLDDPDSSDYEHGALRLAVGAHAEIIRIHPFEDGNGRTSRLCADHILVQCGLWPVPIEAVKQEYTTALNYYYQAGDIGPLLDLFIALYLVER